MNRPFISLETNNPVSRGDLNIKTVSNLAQVGIPRPE